MRKVALIAQKGGVGKTTLAVNLAVAAEAAGLATILFDLDHQESAVHMVRTAQGRGSRMSNF